MKRNLTHPLLSWDIFLLEEQRLALLEEENQEIMKMAKKFHWTEAIKSLINEKARLGKTIVLTDSNQSIEWVNSKFEGMTGYSKEEVLGRKPSFLQGKDTCKTTLQNVASAVQKRVKVKEVLVNYRKNGDAYLCQVEIHPVYNAKGLSHFVAFEEEVYQ